MVRNRNCPPPVDRYRFTSIQIREMKITARQHFVEEEEDVAMVRYCREVSCEEPFFWYDKRGQRCVVVKDIDYKFSKHSSFTGRNRMKEVLYETRKFLFYTKEPTLRDIDTPKPLWQQEMVKHCSEPGWNLPVDHVRHFFKFPQEIQNLIFNHILVVTSSSIILPRPTTTNWCTLWKPRPDCIIKSKSAPENPNFGYEHHQHVEQYLTLLPITRQDGFGEFVEYNRFRVAVIDATCLRVCKRIHDTQTETLYAKNAFAFPMVNVHGKRSPVTLIRSPRFDPDNGIIYGNVHGYQHHDEFDMYAEEEYHTHGPNAHLPFPNDLLIPHLIQILHSTLPVPITHLPGSIYYSHLLRFLHAISPRNAHHLKYIRFTGTARLHRDCDSSTCGSYSNSWCDEDLVTSMKVYVPILRSLCHGLESMEILVREDEVYQRHKAEFDKCFSWGSSVKNKRPETTAEAMLSLLEGQGGVRSMASLRELRVVDEDGVAVEWAEPTVGFIKLRANKRVKVAGELSALKRSTKLVRGDMAEDRCAFCGVGHIWAECHNLCNFCGEFGHWRKECKQFWDAELEEWLRIECAGDASNGGGEAEVEGLE